MEQIYNFKNKFPLTCCVYPNHKLNLYYNICKQLVNNGWIIQEFDENKKYDWCSSSRYSKICGVDLEKYIYWQDKFYMFALLKKKKYIPETYIINDGEWVGCRKPIINTVFFVKKCNSDCSKGNKIFDNLNDIIRFSKKNKFTYIVQPSIKTDSYKNTKYDIRIWASLVSNNHINFDFIYYKFGKVRCSNKDYIYNSLDPDIQMTNTSLKNNKEIINFDNDFPNFEEISDQINNIMKNLFESTKDLFINFKKIKKKIIWNTGFDFIVDQNKKCFLLEINNKPNFYKGDYSTEWYKYLTKHVYTPMALNKHPNFDAENVIHVL